MAFLYFTLYVKQLEFCQVVNSCLFSLLSFSAIIPLYCDAVFTLLFAVSFVIFRLNVRIKFEIFCNFGKLVYHISIELHGALAAIV